VAGERVFRYGGDEFVVVVSADREVVEARMRDLAQRIQSPWPPPPAFTA
jgi:GGDEF domain-containing protein